MNQKELDSYQKAGEIAKQIREYVKEIVKPEVKLVDLARKIESKIQKLGGEIAFPVNLSINDIAAHYHPTAEDETLASGLLKIDIGIHIKGFIADTALSIDLTENQEYKELIKSAEQALENALKLTKENPTLNEIGKEIQRTIENKGFSPIVNLSGHSLGEYDIHAGITIPNYANNNQTKLENGAYAIEPFATTGEGKIIEGPSGNIYAIINPKNVRSPKAREILEYLYDKHKTLPFSLREVQDKFGNFARLGIRELENTGILHNYHQLIEKSHGIVAQAEHTFIKKDKDIIVTTRDD